MKNFKEFLESYTVSVGDAPPFSNISQQKDITNSDTDTEVYTPQADKLKKLKVKKVKQ